MTADEIKQLLRERGWSMVELAARWEISITWISRLVNKPASRPAMYEDAFRGLPARASVQVRREARHKHRKASKGLWTPAQMFPPGRVWVAIDSAVVEEGTRLISRSHSGIGPLARVRFELHGEPDQVLELGADEASLHFCDIGLEEHEINKSETGLRAF